MYFLISQASWIVMRITLPLHMFKKQNFFIVKSIGKKNLKMINESMSGLLCSAFTSFPKVTTGIAAIKAPLEVVTYVT